VNVRLLVRTLRNTVLIPSAAVSVMEHGPLCLSSVRTQSQYGILLSRALMGIPPRWRICSRESGSGLWLRQTSRRNASHCRNRSTDRRQKRRGPIVSPSRAFILRPVATVLLMVAIVGRRRSCLFKLPFRRYLRWSTRPFKFERFIRCESRRNVGLLSRRR